MQINKKPACMCHEDRNLTGGGGAEVGAGASLSKFLEHTSA
jgi:hypothetical protein